MSAVSTGSTPADAFDAFWGSEEGRTPIPAPAALPTSQGAPFPPMLDSSILGHLRCMASGFWKNDKCIGPASLPFPTPKGPPATDADPTGAATGAGTATAAVLSVRRASAASSGSSTTDTASSQASVDDMPVLPEGDAVLAVPPLAAAGGPVPDRRGSVASSSGTEGGRLSGPHAEQREAAGAPAAAAAAAAGSSGPSGADAAVTVGSSGTTAQHRVPLAERISHTAADTESDSDSDSGASSSVLASACGAFLIGCPFQLKSGGVICWCYAHSPPLLFSTHPTLSNGAEAFRQLSQAHQSASG